MPLTIKKRNGKEYLYFLVEKGQRLYLGTRENPRKDRVEVALRRTREHIKKYEGELIELETLLHGAEDEQTTPMFYKIIFLDLDGVLVEKPRSESRSDKVAVSTWDVLFQELGIYDTHEKLKQEFESGILSSYMAWTEAACNVLKSIRLNQNTFLDVINRRPIAQGAAELLRELRKNKVKVAIATGSFDALAQRIQNELGPIDYSLAHCKLLFNEKGFLNDWKLQSVDYEDKADFVERVAKKEKVPLNRCAYVGDDVNDLIAFEKVGLAVAFNSKKVKVRQSANLVIDSRDLRAILPHLYVPSARGEIS